MSSFRNGFFGTIARRRASGGAPTVYLSEGFEAVGFENTWTQPVGTTDPNSTDQAHSGTQSLKFSEILTGTEGYAQHVLSSDQDNIDFIFYLYVDTWNTPSITDEVQLIRIGNVAGSFAASLSLTDDVSPALFVGSAGISGEISVAKATWLKVEIQYRRNSASSSLIVNDGSPQTFTANDVAFGQIRVGAPSLLDADEELTVYYDDILIQSV